MVTQNASVRFRVAHRMKSERDLTAFKNRELHDFGNISFEGAENTYISPANGRLAIRCDTPLAEGQVGVIVNDELRFTHPALAADTLFSGRFIEKNEVIDIQILGEPVTGTLELFVIDGFGRGFPIATGNLSAEGVQAGAVLFTGTGNFSVGSTLVAQSAVTFTGTGLLAADGDVVQGPATYQGEVLFTGAGFLSADGEVIDAPEVLQGEVLFTGAGFLSADGEVIDAPEVLQGEVLFTGAGFLSADGEVIVPSSFPDIISISDGASSAEAASHDISMPDSYNVGDLLLFVFGRNGSNTMTVDTEVSGNNWTMVQGLHSFTVNYCWKIAEGSDALRVNFAGTARRPAWIAYVLRNAIAVTGTEVSSGATSAGTNADPPNHAPPNGSKKYLWIAAMGFGAGVIPSAQPSGYSSMTHRAGFDTGTNFSNLACCHRELEASSEDPGAFTSASARWRGFTLAVEPAS